MGHRIFNSRYFMPVLTGFTILALALSVFAVVKFTQEQTRRENDRVAADIAGCERGNDLREQIITLAEATKALPREILDLIAQASSDPHAKERLDTLTDPAFLRFQNAVDAIKTRDCLALIEAQ